MKKIFLTHLPFSHFGEFEKAADELVTLCVGYGHISKYEDLLQIGKSERKINRMELDKNKGESSINFPQKGIIGRFMVSLFEHCLIIRQLSELSLN